MRAAILLLALSALCLRADDAPAPQPAWGRIIQVLPTGVLTAYSSKGTLFDTPCFVACDTKDLVDGLWWDGSITPSGTFVYSDAAGARHTVRKFTGDMATAVKAPQGDPLMGRASDYWQEHGLIH